MPADLHCHTKISDGSTTLEDFIFLVKKRKLTAVSVTDHDTLVGIKRAKVLGDRYGVNVIPGAEFSCWDSKRERCVHILAYLFSVPDRLEGLCCRTGEIRKQTAMKMITKLMRYYPITADMIGRVATGSTNVYIAHMMHTLMNAGYTDTIYGELYNKLFAKGTGLCRVNFEYPDVFETLELLQSAGAITVLAHPAQYDSFDLLPELVEKGLDGVEVWHPSADEETVERLLAYAKANDLLTTGGSDFHGFYSSKPVPIGACTTPDECLEAMYALKEKKEKQRLSAK